MFVIPNPLFCILCTRYALKIINSMLSMPIRSWNKRKHAKKVFSVEE
jgi:hypothetical protein